MPFQAMPPSAGEAVLAGANSLFRGQRYVKPTKHAIKAYTGMTTKRSQTQYLN
jgi:hypothetical protein